MSRNEKGSGGLKDQLRRLFGAKTKPQSQTNQASSKVAKPKPKQPFVRQSEALKRNQSRVPNSPPKSRNTSAQNQEKRRKQQRKTDKQIQEAWLARQKQKHDLGSGLDVYRQGITATTKQPTKEKIKSSLIISGEPESIRASRVFLENPSDQLAPCLMHQRDCWDAVPTEQRQSNSQMLRLGLDMGTSATKVVIMDPVRGNTAWAVPFFRSGTNPYLLPTAISWIGDQPFISGHSNALRPFKWRLISGELTRETLIDAAAYLALVLRHTVAWLNEVHGSYYRPDSLIWEIRVGLPAKSTQDTELCTKYKALLSSAIAIASKKGKIHKAEVESEVDFILSEMRKGEEIRTDRYFENSGMLLPKAPTPEIAANIIGFYRSRKWDPKRPYGLLVDVGASTLDCAFCSFLDREENVFLSEFTRSIDPLGVFRLHDFRVQWLLDQMDAMDEIGSDLVDQLLDDLTSIAFDQSIPARIHEYLDGVEIKDVAIDTDFKKVLANSVVNKNLLPGIRKFFSGHVQAGTVIPVYVSGGGSRHDLFRTYLQDHSNPPNASWSLQIEPLGIPDYVEAPKIQGSDRDRLAVAYGLCADETWEIYNPDEIQKSVREPKDRSGNFVSKDMV